MVRGGLVDRCDNTYDLYLCRKLYVFGEDLCTVRRGAVYLFREYVWTVCREFYPDYRTGVWTVWMY